MDTAYVREKTQPQNSLIYKVHSETLPTWNSWWNYHIRITLSGREGLGFMHVYAGTRQKNHLLTGMIHQVNHLCYIPSPCSKTHGGTLAGWRSSDRCHPEYDLQRKDLSKIAWNKRKQCKQALYSSIVFNIISSYSPKWWLVVVMNHIRSYSYLN